jgi:hypothetical protein
MRPLYRQSLVFWLTIYPILPASAQDRPLDPPASSAATLPLNSPTVGLKTLRQTHCAGDGQMRRTACARSTGSVVTARLV